MAKRRRSGAPAWRRAGSSAETRRATAGRSSSRTQHRDTARRRRGGLICPRRSRDATEMRRAAAGRSSTGGAGAGPGRNQAGGCRRVGRRGGGEAEACQTSSALASARSSRSAASGSRLDGEGRHAAERRRLTTSTLVGEFGEAHRPQPAGLMCGAANPALAR